MLEPAKEEAPVSFATLQVKAAKVSSA